MEIYLLDDKETPLISKIQFNLDYGTYVIEEKNKKYSRAAITDLYNDDLGFVTIEYFEKNDLLTNASESKIIKKTSILDIDVVYSS